MSEICLCMQSLQFQKGITCSSVWLRKEKCNIKLYALPARAFSCRFASTPSASSRADSGGHRKHISSAFTAPNGYQRLGPNLENFIIVIENAVKSCLCYPDKRLNEGCLFFSRPDHMLYRTDGNSMSEFEGQLEELFNEIRMMIMSGRKDDAVELLQANYEAVKEQMESGANGIEQAAVLDIVALGYITVGDLKFVASILDIVTSFSLIICTIIDLKNSVLPQFCATKIILP